MGQSTNDVYPTAIYVALLLHNDKVIKVTRDLVNAFHKKAVEYRDILKMGRTEGQDAVPMTVGQEMKAAGIYEINLPAMQPGSSIMPGKVNPVMPELKNEVTRRR
jgi:aspartate ammonia-lyase